MAKPERTRVYQNHTIDSTRWDRFEHRAGDIVIASSYKSGTTWTQAIVANLLYPDGELPQPVWQLSPWLDMRPLPLERILGGLEAQTGRRFIKTHLPLDALPFDERVQYIFVGRDGRDVAMSLWNHYSHFNAAGFTSVNETPGRNGPPLPPAPADVNAFFRDWCAKGWFEWEGDGHPYWSHLRTVQTWFDWEHLPNIHLLHYADLKEDTAGVIVETAVYLGLERSPAQIAEVLERTGLDRMRADGDLYMNPANFEGGFDTFFFKGTNGRWQDEITPQNLALYDAACERALTPECRAWMDRGAEEAAGISLS